MHISLRAQWRQIIMEATANRFDINMAHSLNNNTGLIRNLKGLKVKDNYILNIRNSDIAKS